MAYTPEQADYYHGIGLMPTWAWMQQNSRSPEYNYEYQKRKMYKQIEEKEAAKRREEAKKQMEQQILDAIVLTMQQGEELITNTAADDIIASVNAAFNGGTVSKSNKSFSAELGAMLGKALGQAPFKLLDDIFKDDEHRRR